MESASSPEPKARRRRTDTAAERLSALTPAKRQSGWNTGAHGLAPIEIVSTADIEAIHRTSLRILAEIGIDLMSDETRALALAHGAKTDSADRVRFPADVVETFVAMAPSRFTITPLDPGKSITVGAGYRHNGCVASAPNATGFGAIRRAGNQSDFRAFVKLAHMLNTIHFFGGYPVEPVDLPAETRHLDCVRDFVTLTDKVFHPYCLGRQRISDAVDITCMAHGIDRAELARHPRMWTVVNSSSPLRYERAMLDGMLEMARVRQPVCFTPFTLAGAMAPVTLAGAIAQQNAEALAGIVLAQMASPGTPVIYGAYTSNVDMQSGAPAMGTPEYAKATLISGQLARRYNLPFRSSGGNSANAVDAQAIYETTASLWSAMLGGANMVMHAAGWLEGGLQASFGKLVIDAEILQELDAFCEPVAINEDTLALDAIREVGPGGHFFGAAHTLSRYETAFYRPLVSDWRNFGGWTAAGGIETLERAETIARQLIEAHEEPGLPPDRLAMIDAFVARRKAEGGALDT